MWRAFSAPFFWSTRSTQAALWTKRGYFLSRKLEFYSLVVGRVITAPEGLPTDLASIPRIPIIYEFFGNRYGRAAVIHDYRY